MRRLVAVSALARNSLRGGLLLALAAVLVAGPAAAAEAGRVVPAVDLSGGFEEGQMALNAGAAVVEGRLRLTDTTSGSQSRTAFLREKLRVDRFVTRFTYRARQVGPSPVGGWAFVLQNHDLEAVTPGQSTGTHGYDPADGGVALLMDLGRRISLHAGAPDGSVRRIKSEPLRPEMGTFADGRPYEFLLTYDGEVLHLVVTDRETGDSYYLHYEIDIPEMVGGRTAWAGFGAGTGSVADRRLVQEIESWSWYAGEGAVPPLAQFELNALSPYQAPQGNVIRARTPYEVEFDAASSVAVEGEVARYEWAFGDGASAAGEESTARHTYREPGLHEASLTVVDEHGNRSDPRTLRIALSDALRPVIRTNRSSGVAPLQVIFDATETEGLTEADLVNCRFAWNFDANDADPQGHAHSGEGFVAAHVFQEPGTYRVTLEVTDVSGETVTDEVVVEVHPLDETWTTYHFSTDGDDENPGTIEAPKRTLEHGLGELAGPRVRIRLRRGDTWRLDNPVTLATEGPVLVDSYSDPERPSEQRPVIRATWTDGAWRMLPVTGSDWRVTDLVIRAGSNSYSNPREPGAMQLDGRDNLISGVHFTRIGTNAFILGGDGNVIHDCTARDVGPYFVYGSPRRFAIIDNDVEIESEHDEHVLRFQGGHKGYIAGNKLRSKKAKSNVQVRGASSQMVIYDNDIIGRTSSANPQNRTSEEYVHHIVWEANRFLYEPAYEDLTGFAAAGTAVNVNARHLVIRNNVTVNYMRLFGVGGHPLVGGSVNIHVYNNTIYADDVGGKHHGRLGDIHDGRLVNVRNNLVYSDVTTTPDPWVAIWRVSEGAVETLTSDHNLLWAPAWDTERGLFRVGSEEIAPARWREMGFGRGTLTADPGLRSTDPDSADFLRLMPGSAAVDAGAEAPVFVDHEGRRRPQGRAHDIGAFEHPADDAAERP